MKCSHCDGRSIDENHIACTHCNGTGEVQEHLLETRARLFLQTVIGLDCANFDDNSQLIASAAILIEARLRDLVAAVKGRK